MCVYINICVCEACLDRYISIATWPSQTNILGSALHTLYNIYKKGKEKHFKIS